MLRDISISNFQKHAKLEVEFTPGSTVIVGDNWRGKSTIVRAIQYALFGPAVIPGGAKVLQSRGRKGKPKVVLNFFVNDDDYCVTRSFSTTRLTKNTKVVATGANPVTSYIEELVGLSGRLFVDLRTAPQDEAGSILTLGSTKLGGLLDAATQVDVVDRVISSAARQASSLGEKISNAIEIDLEAEQAKLWEQYNETQKELRTLEAAKSAATQATSEAKTAGEAYTELAAAREQAQELRKSRDELTGQEKVISKRVLDITQMLERMPVRSPEEVTELAEGYAAALAKYSEEMGRESKFVETHSALDSKMIALMEIGVDLQAQVDLCNNGCTSPIATLFDTSELVARDEELRISSHAVKTEYDSRKKDLETYVCSACGRPFHEDTYDPEAMKKDLVVLEDNYLSVGKEWSEVHRELEDKEAYNTVLTEALSALQGAVDRMSENLSKRSTVEEEIAEHEKTRPVRTPGLEEKLKEDYRLLEEDRKLVAYRTTKQEELEKESSELEKVQERISIIEAENLNPVSAEDVQRAHGLYAVAHQAASKATTDSQVGAEKYRSALAQYTAACETFAAIKETEEAQEKDRTRKILLSRLQAYLRKNRDAFTTKVWGSLLSYASDFVSQATTGTVTQVTRDQQGQFSYLEDGHEMPIQMASGLQRAIIGVAVRLALANAVGATARFFLLDEPTAGASDVNSMAVAQALSTTGLQIVMVTHRQADTAVADGTISL